MTMPGTHTSLPVTDTRTRFEWVKMFYPDMPKGIPVGIIRQSQSPVGLWVFDHRTPDSQWSDTYRSPMGLDVGTLLYLRTLQPEVAEVHWGVRGARTEPVLVAPLPLFLTVGYVLTRLPDGSPRTRIFLPIEHWATRPYYEPVTPEYWDATHLRESGAVMARHVATKRVKHI